MRVDCIHGFYKFYLDYVGNLYFLSKYFNTELVLDGDYYTFPKLKELPDISIENQEVGNSGYIAKKTFAGSKWEVMKANEMIYDIMKNKFININEINYNLNFSFSDYGFCVKGLPQAGSLSNMQRIVGFSGFFDLNGLNTKIEAWEIWG